MKNIALLTLIILCSCANQRSAVNAKLINADTGLPIEGQKNDIEVTAEIDEKASSANFTFIKVELENTTEDYIDVEEVSINNDEFNTISVVTGNRLVEWSRAIQRKMAIDQQNDNVLWTAITAVAALGTLAVANNGSYSDAKLMASATGAAAITGEVNQHNYRVANLERGDISVAGHLLTTSTLPPGLVSSKWIVLQHSSDVEIAKIAFTLKTKNFGTKVFSANL